MNDKPKDLAGVEATVDALMSNPLRERHKFIDQVDMDSIVAVLLRLGMEISVLRERLDAHESLAQKYGVYSFDEVDAYQPTAEEAQRRERRRKQLVARIVRDLTRAGRD